MNDYHSRPDGEVFADVQVKPIPHADTWETLSANQLLEVQITLQTRAWEFRNNPPISKSLTVSIQRLQALIDKRLSES